MKQVSTANRQPSSVLFICNQNVVRSPMAEAILRAWYGNSIYSQSAGIRIGDPDPFVEAVMEELNIDVQNRRPKNLEDLDDGYFDLVITLSPTAHHVALEMTHVSAAEVEYWPTADPTVVQGTRQQVLEAYREVRDHLIDRIRERFPTPDRVATAKPTNRNPPKV